MDNDGVDHLDDYTEPLAMVPLLPLPDLGAALREYADGGIPPGHN